MSQYYIQNRGTVGNSVRWWKVDGNGYTCDIREAWLVSKEEARNICAMRRGEDVAWPAQEMQLLASLEVDVQKLQGFKPLPQHRRKRA